MKLPSPEGNMAVVLVKTAFYLIILFGALMFNSTAQTIYTLEDILSIGAKNGNRLKIIENKALAEKQQAQMYLSEALPQIDFFSNFAYSNQSQLGTQLTSTTDIIAIFDRIDGLLFNWSVSLQQPLFDFGKLFNSFKLASLGMDILEQNRLLQRNLYFLEVIGQFIKSYMYQFEYAISLQSLKHSRRLMDKMELDFKYNQTSRTDLLRTRSAFENNNADSIKARTNKELARKTLNLLIGLADSTVYDLVLDTPSIQYKQENVRTSENIEVRLKTLETTVNKRLRHNTWAALFPKLNLTASISNEIFIIDTTGMTGIYLDFIETSGGLPPGAPEVLFPQNPGAVDFFNPDYFNYSIGLLLTWNIFDGTRSWASYKQAKLKEEQSKLELTELKRENTNTQNEINGQIKAITCAIEAYRFQLEASNKALEQAESDYKDGFINAVNYIEINNEYRNAALQLDNAILQKLLLQARLQIALGLPVYKDN